MAVPNKNGTLLSKLSFDRIAVLAAIAISLMSLLASCIQGCSSRTVSLHSNQLATKALESAALQHDDSLRYQERVRQLELKDQEPNIALIRKHTLDSGDLIATIQNVGGRPAALFSIKYVAISEMGFSINTLIPSGIQSKTIVIDWRKKPTDRALEFEEPPVVPAGGIVNIRIKPPDDKTGGGFTLQYSNNGVVGLGSFSSDAG